MTLWMFLLSWFLIMIGSNVMISGMGYNSKGQVLPFGISVGFAFLMVGLRFLWGGP